MGMWIELGIFILVLVFAIWQIRDARRALERTRALKASQASQARPPQEGDEPAP